jgi:flagellar basal body-associated protein FliL
MAEKKRIKLEWIIIILLFVIIIVGAFFIFSNKSNITVKNEQKADSSSIAEKIVQPDLMKKYDKLE